MDSYDAKKSDFNSRGKALEKPFLTFKNRKAEHQARSDSIPLVFDLLKKMKDDLPGILASKPWITEDESKDAFDRIEETVKWLEEKVQEQSKRALSEDPAFRGDDIVKRVKKAEETYKKVTNKKQPKEKKPKKTEETEEEEKADL